MNYPIGIQDFAKLRGNDFVYVDKTDLVFELTKCKGVYSLIRPRRFGKSLLVSTIKYFDRPATEAMTQIADRGYADPYTHDSRTVYAIACSFSSETGTISDWQVKQIKGETSRP